MILKTNIAASSISNDNGIPDAEEYIGQKVFNSVRKVPFS